jgi:tRNA threonylcarbamoyladenosine biosynthesis protein TsaE
MEIHTTLKDLNKVAKDLLKKVSNLKNEKATVVALRGDLGSGKTTFTQELAKVLGVKKNIISPTFVIMKSYDIKSKKFEKLIHIDAYRLEKSEELTKLGWGEVVNDPKNLIILEWPEKVPECIPKNTIFIDLYHKDHQTRTIRL